ncbi:MAG TPA: hypothetical protein VJB88_04835 [Vicinamibacteria bacterium]|nr:hypothetical protein [Vicinamibacteria bacterium]
MSRKLLMLGAVLGTVCLTVPLMGMMATSVPDGVGPQFQSAGPLTFGPDGILFAADIKGATIYALDLGDAGSGKTPGVKSIPAIDQKIAALLGTDAREIAVADLAVSPKSKNVFLSVTRGQGANAKPVLLRVDGAGAIEVISLDTVGYTSVALPNPPKSDPSSNRDPGMLSITDMAYVEGRLFIAGLSNEEFASKLRSVNYPFDQMDNGTSVEIWHGSHGAWETRSPVYSFVPYDIDNEPYLVAGYLCTPLVKFPVAKLKAGQKLVGTTIAELGNRNRPIDMIVYKKDGKDYLLMSNTSRGVMKIPTDNFGSQAALTSPVEDKAGIAYETIATMKGVEQLDLLDDSRVLIASRADSGELNLETVALP